MFKVAISINTVIGLSELLSSEAELHKVGRDIELSVGEHLEGFINSVLERD